MNYRRRGGVAQSPECSDNSLSALLQYSVAKTIMREFSYSYGDFNFYRARALLTCARVSRSREQKKFSVNHNIHSRREIFTLY